MHYRKDVLEQAVAVLRAIAEREEREHDMTRRIERTSPHPGCEEWTGGTWYLVDGQRVWEEDTDTGKGATIPYETKTRPTFETQIARRKPMNQPTTREPIGKITHRLRETSRMLQEQVHREQAIVTKAERDLSIAESQRADYRKQAYRES